MASMLAAASGGLVYLCVGLMVAAATVDLLHVVRSELAPSGWESALCAAPSSA